MKTLIVIAGLCLSSVALSQTQETKTGSLVVGVPTGGNEGPGTVNATGLYVNGTPVNAGSGNATSINGASVPASDFLIGTNSSGQLVTPSVAAGTVVAGPCSGSPAAPTATSSPCIAGTVDLAGNPVYNNSSTLANSSLLYSTPSVSGTAPTLQYSTPSSVYYFDINPDTLNTTTNGVGYSRGLSLQDVVATGHSGGRNALEIDMNVTSAPSTAASNFYTGIQSYAYGAQNNGGTSGVPQGNIIGMATLSTIQGAGTYYGLVEGLEASAAVFTGGSVQNRFGVDIVPAGNVNATYDDAGLVIRGAATAEWGYGILFGGLTSGWSLSGTSTMIGAVAKSVSGSSSPIALNGVDFSNVVFQTGGCAFKSTSFCVDPSGNVSANSYTGPIGSSTPNAGAFTTVTGSTSVISPIGSFGAIGSITPGTGTFTSFQANNVRVLGSSVPANGIYLPASNVLGFSTNTTEQGFMDANGNLALLHAYADQSKSVQTPTTGFSITVANNISTLYLTPAGTLATGTITMPTTPIDGQQIQFGSSQTITALTVSPNTGQTINGAPTTLTANTGFEYIYNLGTTTWLRLR